MIKHKFRTKLSIILVVSILIPLCIAGCFSYIKSYDILNQKLSLTSEQTIGQIQDSMDEFLSSAEWQAKSLAQNSAFRNELLKTSQGEENKNIINETLKNITESNKNIYESYYGTNEKKFYLYPKDETLDSSYDPTTREWYEKAVQNQNTAVWTDPYKDSGAGGMVVTTAAAVVNNGQVVGVVGIDINLKNYSEKISKNKIGREGYIFVTDKMGTYIFHKDQSMIGKNEFSKLPIWKEISTKEKGFTKYKINGKEEFVSYTTDPITGWKIISCMPRTELLSDTNVILKFTIYAILIGGLLAILMAFLIARAISIPLNKLSDSFSKASHGDLTSTVDIRTNDEFQYVGDNFNLMLNKISELLREVKESSNTVYEASNALSAAAEQTSNSSNEISATVEEIAVSASEQAKNTEIGTIEVDELSSSIEEVVGLTKNIGDITRDTEKLSTKGVSVVDILAVKSKESENAAQEVNNIVKSVDERSIQIGAITQTVQQIASQTNLLALNAAIEAARAGEAGRGFAVVADEVRKLAEQSATATKEITNLINEIQSQSKGAVNAVINVNGIVKEQYDAVKETQDIFVDISKAIRLLMEKVNDIENNSSVMREKESRIVDVINNIAAGAEESSAGTQEASAGVEEQLAAIEEVAAYARELNSLATGLDEKINKFNIAKVN